jgi:hypothetical protein
LQVPLVAPWYGLNSKEKNMTNIRRRDLCRTMSSWSETHPE